MYTLGSRFIPPPIHAGGLRYHGSSPFLSAMYTDNAFDAVAIDQLRVLAAGLLFAETEGVLPAPESAHAIAGAVDLACGHGHQSTPLVLLINISGHGLLDMSAYERYRSGSLDAGQPDEELLGNSLRQVDEFNALLTTGDQRNGTLTDASAAPSA